MSKVSRVYHRYYGGWGCGDDEPWCDIEEFVCYEGDPCPDCEKGKLKISSKGNLYCSQICWVEELDDLTDDAAKHGGY